MTSATLRPPRTRLHPSFRRVRIRRSGHSGVALVVLAATISVLKAAPVMLT